MEELKKEREQSVTTLSILGLHNTQLIFNKTTNMTVLFIILIFNTQTILMQFQFLLKIDEIANLSLIIFYFNKNENENKQLSFQESLKDLSRFVDGIPNFYILALFLYIIPLIRLFILINQSFYNFSTFFNVSDPLLYPYPLLLDSFIDRFLFTFYLSYLPVNGAYSSMLIPK